MSTPQWARMEVTLRQHAAIGAGARSDFRHDTVTHVPGSVLRGACAAAWIRDLDPATDRDFLDIFEGDGVFGPAHTEDSLPTPLSVLAHKHEPGPRCERRWWDEALGETTTGSVTEPTCKDCGQRLERSRGEPIGPVAVRSRMRVELTASGVPVAQKLFERSALAAGTTLTAWLSGAAVRALDREDVPVTRLKLGGERSIRGAAEVALHHSGAPEPVELRGDGHVILRLCAPGIFVDSYGLPADRPDDAELSEALGTDATVAPQPWTRWGTVGGWHAASGLPKPVERAVVAGSTFLVRCAHRPDEDTRRALRVRGVGLRRREGFGALYLPPDPSRTPHWWFQETAVLVTRPEWRSLLPHLRARSTGWPPDPQHDQRLAAALRKVLPRLESAALDRLLEITDHALYDTVLDRLERP